MTSKVAKPPAAAKSARFPKRNRPTAAGSRIGNRNVPIGNQISPVMQKVKALLPPVKAAQHLAILIDEPLSNCQKLLAGFRTENSTVLTKLLRSPLGREVLFALMGDENPEWFSKYRKQLDVNAARRQLEENRRAIEALQAEAAE
jgi:hypothetical protein